MPMRATTILAAILLLIPTLVLAGPFPDAGYEKDDPTLVAWATGWENYLPAENVDPSWTDPGKALGPATGNPLDVVALGEREAGSKDAPGEITFTFDELIGNRTGPDFVVFENSFVSAGGLFIELAFVEVSSDGDLFARFPSVSLTPDLISQYGILDQTDIHNLVGQFQNAFGTTQGTPFDLTDLADHPDVLSGAVDLDVITHVKIVDIPGAGDYFDQATAFGYDSDNPIYDPHPTIGSGGSDIEAVALIGEPVADDDDDTTLEDDDDDASDDDDDSSDDDGGESDTGGDSGCG
jgi:hypothetical protein